MINAVLYEDGKVPEERERFTIVVMGFNSTGKRDFKSEVGILIKRTGRISSSKNVSFNFFRCSWSEKIK